jgi:pimeloyl-ACP methyl ester carboxylesterase
MAERRSPTVTAAGSPATAPAEAGGIRVHASRRGQAHRRGDLPIVVLHGWGAHLAAVEPIVAPLAEEAEVLALDLPGFGDSDDPPEAWDSEDYARFMVEWLERAGIRRCHLIGHSFGGRVAICLAARHPELVDRLILCDAAGLRPKRGMRYRLRVALAKLGRLLGLFGPPGRRLQARIRSRVASADYLSASPAMRETFRRVIAEDLADRLPRISLPCLLVWGSDDEDTPAWMGRRMEELLPDGALVVFEGAGHYAYADEPRRFAQLSRHFLCEQPREVASRNEAP